MRRASIVITSVLLSFTLLAGGYVAVDRAAAATRVDDIVGSWQLSLTDSSAPPEGRPIPALATFFSDGNFITADLPVTPAVVPLASPETSPPPSEPLSFVYTTAGHGVWTATGTGRAALTFVELTTDGAGSFLATVTVSATVKVDETGDTITGPYTASSIGPDGEQLAISTGTLRGTRITISLIADFTVSQDAGTLDVSFVDRSAGDPTDWTWDFGDDHTGSRQNPTHSYAEPGDYEVTMTVTNASSTDTKTKTVTVKSVPAPVADFTTSQAPGTLDVAFTDTSTGDPTDWRWDFGDGRTSSRQNPTHTWAKTGDHQVKLTVTNAGGSDSRTRTITVKSVPAPVADFTTKQDAGTLAVQFTDTSTGHPTDWAWDFGDGKVGDRQNPTHTYAEAGDYKVSLKVRNATGPDTKTITITVKPAASPAPG